MHLLKQLGSILIYNPVPKKDSINNIILEKWIMKAIKKAGNKILSSVGCYLIEKEGPRIIESIKGDFFNVMGFPLFPFLLFLKI